MKYEMLGVLPLGPCASLTEAGQCNGMEIDNKVSSVTVAKSAWTLRPH